MIARKIAEHQETNEICRSGKDPKGSLWLRDDAKGKQNHISKATNKRYKRQRTQTSVLIPVHGVVSHEL
jgi:hypothetical protein